MSPLSDCKKTEKYCENTMGKSENAGDQHFSPFPTLFLTLSLSNLNFSVTLFRRLQRFQLKLLSSSKELTHYHTVQQFDRLKIYSCGKHCKSRRNCL